MRPRPLCTEPLADARYVRDRETGLVWHRVPHRVLYIDTDRSGTVYHSNYFRYFELGRCTLLRDAAHPYREIEDEGYVYPVYRAGCDYTRALLYDDDIWIHTRFRMIERVRVGFDYAITRLDSTEVACAGFTLHCATGRSGR